jgi:PIN domain nuclease of toxin-antitoxin system
LVVIDTHVLIQDALDPKRLSARARKALEGTQGDLAASDMSLWEMAMLIAKGRVVVAADAATFIETVLEARSIRVLPITAKIAVLSQSDQFEHGDPADRVIAATAIAHGAQLITADAQLSRVRGLRVLW